MHTSREPTTIRNHLATITTLITGTVIPFITYMAEFLSVAPSPSTPAAAPIISTSLPSTPSSAASPIGAVVVAEGDTFLKPTNPRKRPRPLGSPRTSSDQSTGSRRSPALLSPKPGLSPLSSPVELTAVAEMAEQKKKRKIEAERDQARQVSPNPQRTALGALLGQGNSMSRPQDAPNAANTLNSTLASIAPAISIPSAAHGESSVQTSPVSMSSFGTLDNAGATTMTANGQQVASPGPMAEEGSHEPEHTQTGTPTRAETGDSRSNKAFTYPGPLLGLQLSDPRRGVSLPGSSNFARDDSRSPSSSNKKHKCPYCETEFTRHHNLKSHLLTHSHEKPYMCQTCDSRFRRLHDLKRHTKLHTGERPHVCPKCKRSFARGDALARHNKGQGGCAGRRSSVGSYGGDGQGDESMDGLMYTGETSHEPENMDDDDEGIDDRGQTLPSIRRHGTPSDSQYRQSQDSQSANQSSRPPSTYPPVAMRQPTGRNLFPPAQVHGSSSSSTSPGMPGASIPQHTPGGSITSLFQAGGPNVFAQGSMTESPKPLSPGGNMQGVQHNHSDTSIHRNRSPSLTTQFQQHQYGRRVHGHGTSPPMGLPPPMSSSTHSTAPHLPSLVGLNPPEPRFTLPSQTTGPPHGPPHPSGGVTPSSYHSQQGGLSSHSNSNSSHGTHPHGSGDRTTLPYLQAEERIWAIVKALESKVDRLQEEVTSLRAQLGSAVSR